MVLSAAIRDLRAARPSPPPSRMRAHLPAFVQHLTARAAASRTIESYERTVRQFLDQLEEHPSTCGPGDVEAFLARPRQDGKPRAASTKRAELMALRAFFRFVARDGAVVDATHGISVKRERREAAPVAMPADVPLLFEAAARSSSPSRNIAILGLLHVLGLRVHELVALDVEHVDLMAKALRRVRGKGGTVVDFPLPTVLVAILARWLRDRAMLGHVPTIGPLFPTARPTTSRTGRLSVRSLQRLVSRLARDAGITQSLGPHALRHGTATAAIFLGVDVPATAELMRHASIVTTQGYIHALKDGRRDAVEKIASLIPNSVIPTPASAPSEPRNHNATDRERGGSTPLDVQPL